MRLRWPQATCLLLIAAFLIGQATSTLPKLVAENDSGWMQNTPKLTFYNNRSPIARSNYNNDCLLESGLTRRAAVIPSLIPPQVTEQKVEGCAVYTPYGKFINGLLRQNNTELYGEVSESFRPIPGSSSALRFFNGTSQVSNAYLIPDVWNLLKPVSLSDGKIRYDLKPYEPQYLRDNRGNYFDIDHNSVSYSRDGEWLVASTFQGLARINVRTRAALLFDEPLRYGSGLSLALQTAITPNGRYAVVASATVGRFRIYDLEDCPVITDQLLNRKACRYKDIWPQLASSTGNPIGLLEVRFLSDLTISFYRQEQAQSQQIIASVPGKTDGGLTYLALGDSYTSGEGAYSYRDGTDIDNNHCRNSWLSYPYLIKQSLALPRTESVACAGAVRWDIANDDPDYPGQVQDGVKKRDRQTAPILSSFMPGFLPQKDFISFYQPGIITVSVGGNNIGFGDKLARCLKPGTCFASYEDRLEVFREISNSFDDTVRVYEDIRRSAPPDTKVYAIGYPEIAKSDGQCGHNVWLSPEEIEFSNQLIGQLNQMLHSASQKAGLIYLDVSQAFYGHRLCEAAYSDSAVNGVTAGDDKINWWFIHGPIAGESFHPTALGHRLYRDMILRQSDNFGVTASPPVSTIAAPAEDPNAVFLQAPKTNRKISSLKYSPGLTPALAVKGGNLVVTSAPILKPGSAARVTLEDIGLRDITTNEQGRVITSVSVPSLSPNSYTIHVYGESITGESLDLYKTIYLAASEQDLDGDGIQNSTDNCLLRGGVTEDHDLDGIDDACDGYITEPFTQIAAPLTNLLGHDEHTLQMGGSPLAVVPHALSSHTAATRIGGLRPSVSLGSSTKTLGAVTPRAHAPSLATRDSAPPRPSRVGQGLVTIGIVVVLPMLIRSYLAAKRAH